MIKISDKIIYNSETIKFLDELYNYTNRQNDDALDAIVYCLLKLKNQPGSGETKGVNINGTTLFTTII